MTCSTSNNATTTSSFDSQQAQNQSSTTTTTTFRILAVYKFVQPKLDPATLYDLKQDIEAFCREHLVRGSLLLAPEGINGTIDYPLLQNNNDNDNGVEQEAEDPVLAKLQCLFPGIRTRISYSDHGHVFYRFKVKLKSEILTCHPNTTTDSSSCSVCLDPTKKVGTYVPPGPEWNQLLQDPDCFVVDARNEYEVRIGSFRNAHNPHTETFSELIPWMQEQLDKQKPAKVAMFCTGGIRCEKASAACLDLLSDSHHPIPVYHLEGGILAYLDTVSPDESLWEGDCYVFDQRVALTHGLQVSPNNYSMCHACRAPLPESLREGHEDFISGKQCCFCKNRTTVKQQERFDARQKQIQLAQQKGLLHMHDPKEKVLTVLGGGGGGNCNNNNNSSDADADAGKKGAATG